MRPARASLADRLFRGRLRVPAVHLCRDYPVSFPRNFSSSACSWASGRPSAWSFCRVLKNIRYLFLSPELREKRARAVAIAGGLSARCCSSFFWFRCPHGRGPKASCGCPRKRSCAPEPAALSTGSLRQSDSAVTERRSADRMLDPLLKAEVRVQQAQLNALQARYDAEILTERVRAQVTREEMDHARANLARSEERFRELTMRSQSEGTIVIPRAEDLPGRYRPPGRTDCLRSEHRTAHGAGRGAPGRCGPDTEPDQTGGGAPCRAGQRSDSCEQSRGPHPGLPNVCRARLWAVPGEGAIATDPRDPQGTKTMEKVFSVDIELAKAAETVYVNDRVYVKFDHGFEPLSVQWYRSLRRLFLRWFHV